MLSETVTDANGAHRLDREYVWDAHRVDHLVCRIRHLPSGPERLFPLYDPHGQVQALVDEGCDVLERYALDPQGHVRYLNADFSVKTAPASGYDWQHFCAGLRHDPSGLIFGRATYYQADLGRALPRGPIGVLPESRLNSYVQDFPTGDWQPPHASVEALYKWYNERSPWIKAGLGAIAMLIAVGVVAGSFLTTGPGGVLPMFGAIAGGLQGGIGAHLHDGNFGDILLGAGVGALFGAICPWGAFGSLAGSFGFAGAAYLAGGGHDTIVTAWDWGGLIGGVAGSVPYGLKAVIPELGGGLFGAGLGLYASGGDWDAALMGASFGMMVGGIGGGVLSGPRSNFSRASGSGRFRYSILPGTERYRLPRPDEIDDLRVLMKRTREIAYTPVFLRKNGLATDAKARELFDTILNP